MDKILSVSSLALAAAAMLAPFVAGMEGGVNLPSLADPNGYTNLPLGILLHASWTPLGYALAAVGMIATLVAGMWAMVAFSSDSSSVRTSLDRIERAEMDYIEGRLSADTLDDIQSGIHGR